MQGRVSSATSVHLTWTSSTVDVGVTGYHVYRDGTLVAPGVTNTSDAGTGVTTGRTYTYTLAAFAVAVLVHDEAWKD